MKYVSALKDIVLTILLIFSLFFLLSYAAKKNITVSKQNNDVITLVPLEAYLRGSIKVNDKNMLVNWRNDKNIVHWKFECTKEGKYKVNLIHGETSMSHQIVFVFLNQKITRDIELKSKETELGFIELKKGVHEVAFYAPEVPKKTKLPSIYSIILTKI